MAPPPSLQVFSLPQVNDGTRMLTDTEGLWKLFEAFKRVLREASIDFQCFTATKDDPKDLIDFLLE